MWRSRVVVGPFQCNCQILVCPKTGDAALIDPGDEAPKILSKLRTLELPGGVRPQVKWLLHTHAHLDHIGGTRGVKTGLATKPKIALHPADLEIYQALPMQGQMFGLKYDAPLPVEHRLQDGETIQLGEMKLEVIHTPGHSPGSVGIRVHDDSGLKITETVFTGDTLFQGSVGRTDLWGADGDQMFRSIKERLFSLDGDTAVCPGHGLDSTIGEEKRSNPFVGAGR